MIESLIHDVRYAVRTLAKSPGFAFVAIVSLALGIGANSTIFSLVHATLFPTLPYLEAGRLGWRAQTRAFASIGASREDEFVLSGTDEAVRVPGALVSFDLFSTLGVRPALGRPFSADEDRAGAGHTIMLVRCQGKRSGNVRRNSSVVRRGRTDREHGSRAARDEGPAHRRLAERLIDGRLTS
jgi:hypothetical protein